MNALNVVLAILSVWFFLRALATYGHYAFEHRHSMVRLLISIAFAVALGQRLGGWL